MPSQPCGISLPNASKVPHMPAATTSPAITPYFTILRHIEMLPVQ
jgi:hypothetical protein